MSDRDINLEMIRAGFAWYFRRYERELDPGRRRAYGRAEDEARQARRGLWADAAPVAPWEYRAARREGN